MWRQDSRHVDYRTGMALCGLSPQGAQGYAGAENEAEKTERIICMIEQPKYLYRETSSVWFDNIDEYLRTNNIAFNYVDIPYTSWRCYRVSVTEAEKLPKWGDKPYLPVAEDKGFELWRGDPLDYEMRAIQFGGWK